MVVGSHCQSRLVGRDKLNNTHQMKALNTFRHLIILFVFALAASTASASEGGKKSRKAVAHAEVACTAKPERKEVAPFVDPTLPLTELVERARTERTH